MRWPRVRGKIDRIIAGVDNLIGGPEGKGDVPDAVRAIKNTAENLDKKIDGLVGDGRRTLGVIERAVRNLDENPSRLIFGGGKPGNPPPAQPAAASAGDTIIAISAGSVRRCRNKLRDGSRPDR